MVKGYDLRVFLALCARRCSLLICRFVWRKVVSLLQSSVVLKVSGLSGSLGRFAGFGQRMEALALLLESSELQLKAVIEIRDADLVSSVVHTRSSL